MIEQRLGTPTTRDYFSAALERYVDRHPPPGIRKAAFVAGPVTSRFSPDGLEQTATIYDASDREHRVPIVELWVVVHPRTCEVTIRYYDSRLPSWLQPFIEGLPGAAPSVSVAAETEKTKSTRLGGLLAWIKPGQIDPVDETENVPGAAASNVKASMSPPVPEPPAPALAPVQREAPSAPKRDGFLRDWKAVWNRIKPLAADGKSCAYIEGWLLIHDDDHHPSSKTIAKIIKAGEAGHLD